MQDNNSSNHIGFSPIVFEDSEILILGSFPSVKSRENNFYYANKRNRFWPALSNIFESPIVEDIQDKINLCKLNKIALWDVASQSDLKGSSDSELEKSKLILSDIEGLLHKYSNIKKILCNGSLAYKILTKNFSINIPIIKMPSTSPANVRFNEEVWKNELKKDI